MDLITAHEEQINTLDQNRTNIINSLEDFSSSYDNFLHSFKLPIDVYLKQCNQSELYDLLQWSTNNINAQNVLFDRLNAIDKQFDEAFLVFFDTDDVQSVIDYKEQLYFDKQALFPFFYIK